MNNISFAKKLVEKSQLSEADATKFINALCETLADYFKKGEKVVIADFGSFYIRDDQSIQFNPAAKLKEQIG